MTDYQNLESNSPRPSFLEWVCKVVIWQKMAIFVLEEKTRRSSAHEGLLVELDIGHKIFS
jgi:hypothetical protein